MYIGHPVEVSPLLQRDVLQRCWGHPDSLRVTKKKGGGGIHRHHHVEQVQSRKNVNIEKN